MTSKARLRKTRKPRVAEWQNHAEEITRQKATGSPQILSITELCDASGLKPKTVRSYVQRTTSATKGPMSHLMRPAYRVGAVPWWSQAQLEAYLEAEALESRERIEQEAGLPNVSRDEAERQELWTLRRLAEWAGLAAVTIYRHANEEGFPEPVAVVRSKGPRPLKVRQRSEVETWLRERRPGWEPPAMQEEAGP